MGHKNSNKHKAMHGGYRVKPGKKEINALCDMYAAIADIVLPETKIPTGTQLKLNL